MFLFLFVSFLFRLFIPFLLAFHSLSDDQFAAVISLSLEIVPWLSVIWLLWLCSCRVHFSLFTFCARLLYGNINCILFVVFFLSIVLNVASHRAASKCYLMTSKEIDWNQIVKAVALLMFGCVCVCGVESVARSFQLEHLCTHIETGIQSIRTIGNKAQKLKTHHTLLL